MAMPEDDFNECLVLSHGVSTGKSVKTILLENIPGAVNIFPAHQENDRNGTDWWVELSCGSFLSVDTKIRKEDWAANHPKEDDLALETYSVIKHGVPEVIGWTRNPKKRTDYILWFWRDTGRWCLVPFRLLCKVFQDNWENWRDKYRTETQHTRRPNSEWHSECVFVPRKIVWAEIYKHYSGLLPKRETP